MTVEAAGPAEATAGDAGGKAIRTRTVESPAGAELYVVERGDASAPTIVCVHGYPDTHGCWDELTERLSERFHTVAYDVRGMGRSTAPDTRDAYSLDQLAIDLGAVIDAVSPDRPVHLIGHDWGAFQCWEAITDGTLSERIASLTAVAGPRVDTARSWMLRRLRPNPASLAQLAGQARRSWYIAAFQIPALPERAISAAIERSWPEAMRRVEGIDPREGHPAPTLASDARTGIALYRTNLRRMANRPDRGPAPRPVQIIVPTKDNYISTALYDDCDEWATRVWRRDIRAGHWAQRSHPDTVARYLTEFVDHVEGAPAARALKRAHLTDDDLPLHGRLAVVTGAGSGIGRATALALAAEGAEVIAADINLDGAIETAGLADARDRERLHAIRVDVGDREAMERFATETIAAHGVPQIVVNNAGIGVGGPFLATTVADWERIIGINLWGVIHGSRLFAQQMVDAGVEGQIVNVASAAAYMPSRTLSAYSTTKAAVLMLSECMRAELAGAGIGVTAICPGIVDTNITRTTHMVGVDAEDERAMQARAARAYGIRGYGPEGVARAIVRAVHHNRAVVPVTPEAHVMRALSQLTPGLVRQLARLDPGTLGKV